MKWFQPTVHPEWVRYEPCNNLCKEAFFPHLIISETHQGKENLAASWVKTAQVTSNSGPIWQSDAQSQSQQSQDGAWASGQIFGGRHAAFLITWCSTIRESIAFCIYQARSSAKLDTQAAYFCTLFTFAMRNEITLNHDESLAKLKPLAHCRAFIDSSERMLFVMQEYLPRYYGCCRHYRRSRLPSHVHIPRMRLADQRGMNATNQSLDQFFTTRHRFD